MLSVRGAGFTAMEMLLLAACLFVLVTISAAVARGTGKIRAGIGASGLFAIWFLLVWELSRMGLFEGARGDARTALTLAVVVPLAGALLAGHLIGARWLGSLAPGRNPGAAHLYRLSSVVALAAWISEALPAWVAVPVGLGEPLVAILGAALGWRGSRLPAWWHGCGIAVAAFTILAVTASGSRSAYFFTLYPLVLIPAFLAPISIMLHAWGMIGRSP
ncbi:MAG: hypothetical protein KatS3mg081_2731 [Gemmatimonadales bacterium]|nr:hypothetical protein HRbin33_01735 [bacterium HR33]GIW53376.1 MAG: hypothetical protein KatS3mg081_2731 [Gemmatimonadales bacterium]